MPAKRKESAAKKKNTKNTEAGRQQTIVETLNSRKKKQQAEEEKKQEEADATQPVESILTGSFLTTSSNSSELSRRLKQTWLALKKTVNQNQGDVPLEQLRLVCAEILHEKIMEHEEKSIRSLAACCLTELLRVYAPDMPFKSNEELYEAFHLIMEQIRSLSIATNTDRTAADLYQYQILESLANVKSCLLLIGVDYIPDEGEDLLIVQLFKTMFETIRKDHSVVVENQMLSIMSTCIEESDTIEQPLLDVILGPLVFAPNAPSGGGVPLTTDANNLEKGPYRLSHELIKRTSEHLQSHLSMFFNSILVDAPTTSGFTHTVSELKEHVYNLIYEVHKINPSLLLYVLPNVCMQLQVDEVTTRSDAIALMGRLFASSHADYGHDYMKNFHDFLGRFRDVNKEIRLQMVQVCAIIWQRKPELGKSIEKEFMARLNDPEWEVRRLVVNEVCDLAANLLESVSTECLREVGERMKDKKVLIRKETMTGLSQVYAAHIGTLWKAQSSQQPEEDETENQLEYIRDPPAENISKLAWIPDYVLKCLAYPQQELRLRVVQLLDDILLPKSATSMGRAKGLIFIWRFLDNSSKEAFRRIMQERAKFLKIWHAFVLMKSASKKQQAKKKSASTQLDDKEFAEKEKNVLEEFKLLVPETENPKRLVDQLYAWKDQSVFKHMETLCDQKASTDHIRHARDQLIKCVGSKTALGEYLKNVCRKLNLLTINQESIQCFVQVLQSCFSRGNKNFIATSRESKQSRTICLDILSICAKTLPELLHEPVKKLFGKVLEAATQEDTPESDDDEEPIDSDDSVTQVRRGKRECSPRTNNEKKQMVLGILRILAHYAKFMRKLREDTQNDEETFDFVSMDEDSKLLRILQDFCMTGKSHTNGSMASSQEAAKLAALCYPQLLEVESKKANSLIEKLCQKKSLVVIVPKKTKNRQAQALVGMPQVRSLQSLVKLTKYCSSSFERYSNTLWETLQEEYLGETGVGSSGGMSPVVIAELRCLAIQVAVNLQTLCAIPDNELDLESEAVVKERNEFLKQLLFDLLRSDGKKFTSNAQLALKYRMVAACGLLRMVRQSKFEALMNISNWHLLGFVMQDSEEQVRSSFLRKLTSYLMKKNVPNPQKYMSFLTLAANEPEMRLKKQAKQLLQMSVQRMRKKFELASASKSVALTGVEEDETEDSRQNRNALMVPEYSLPYVIHLLAHHPDCPAPQTANRISGSNTFLNSVWAEQMQYLSFFLDGLISSHAVEVNNIAFLLQICTKMSECHDPTVTNSMKEQKIYPLIDGTVALLKKRIKNISNLKSFPGRIYLPKQLYVIGRAESKTPSKASSNSKTSTSSHETLVSDKKKIPRISTSLSPIKVSGPLDSHFMKMSGSSPLNSTRKRRNSSLSSPGKRSRRSSGASSLASTHENDPFEPEEEVEAVEFDVMKEKVVQPPPKKKTSRASPRNSTVPAAPRRTTPTRRARTTKNMADQPSESDEDSDSFVPSASVAFRASKKRKSASPASTKKNLSTPEVEEDEITSFRFLRRRQSKDC